jgi:hypothetical protein
MSLRSEALEWLAARFGVRGEPTYTSKFYVPEESWTGESAWWLEIPLHVIGAAASRDVHLLCQTAPDASTFHYLRVPTEFMTANLSKLILRDNDRASLFLSAEPADLFAEKRGAGALSFSSFQVSTAHGQFGPNSVLTAAELRSAQDQGWHCSLRPVTAAVSQPDDGTAVMDLLSQAHSRVSAVIGAAAEPLSVLRRAEEHRAYWRPQNPRLILLAESHVYTTEDELQRRLRECPQLPSNLPRGYVRLVYCLGYGENAWLDRPIVRPRNGGTPQFWKIFQACLSRIAANEDFAPTQLSRTRDSVQRLTSKLALLSQLRERGIWLVDASIAALYAPGAVTPSREQRELILHTSWDAYTKSVVESAGPAAILCVGTGIARALRTRLERLGIPWAAVPQPQARLPTSEHMRIFATYHAVCEDPRRIRTVPVTVQQALSPDRGPRFLRSLGPQQVNGSLRRCCVAVGAQMLFNSFIEWVEAEVLPLQRANPTWYRLDGWAEGGNRAVVARFRHAGRVWQVHGDTHFDPILRAYNAVRLGEYADPFVVGWARTRNCLNLASGLSTRPKYFYVYQQGV